MFTTKQTTKFIQIPISWEFLNSMTPTGILNSYCEHFMQPTKQMELQCTQWSQTITCGDTSTTKPNIIKHETK
jgi:hypothetical protein